MTSAPDISSPSNPRIKRLIALRDRQMRDEESVLVVEGADVGLAIAAGLRPIEVYYDKTLFPAPPFRADSEQSVSPDALDRASYRKTSQGVIAVFRQFDLSLGRLHLGIEPLVLVVEGVEKPGNLGAMLRTADAAGVDAVVVADPGTDVFNPNVARASLGTLFTVPLAVTDLVGAARWLHDAGLRVVAAHPSAETSMWAVDLTGPCALLVGAEHAGLSPAALEIADQRVAIPMAGRADSLNASVAAALLVYEAVRQRRER